MIHIVPRITFGFLAGLLSVGLIACTTVEEKVSKTPSASPVPSENPVISAQHVFNVPPARVWEVLSQTRYIQQWWGPHGFTAQIKKNDFKKGGQFLFGMEGVGFPMSWNVGSYAEIIPQKKIVMRMNFADDKGRAVPAAKLGMPGKWDDFVVVTLDLRDLNGQTHVKLTQTGIPAEMSQPASMGWVQQFDKMDKLLGLN